MVETRKIQVTGGSTFIVSIPGQWVRENGMTKGSSVTIAQENSSLIVKPEQYKEKEIERIIELGEKYSESLLQRILISSYISGFDSLKINSRTYINAAQRDIIKKFTRVAMGVELLEETSLSITLQNVLDSRSFPTINALKRMIVNVQAMITDTTKAFENGDSALLENIISRDDDVDRYHFYMMKETLPYKGMKGPEVFNMVFSRILERIADHTVNICQVLMNGGNIGIEQKDALKSFMEFCGDLFIKTTTMFFNVNLYEINELVSRKEQVMKKKGEIGKLKGNSVSSSSIAEEISRIGMYSTDIAELTLDIYTFRNASIRI